MHRAFDPGCAGPGSREHRRHEHDEPRLGMRRPLRFLMHKLGLDEPQGTTFVRILDQLKTERAQVDVDQRRTLAGYADALTLPEFSASEIQAVHQVRQQSWQKLHDVTLKALQELHAILQPEQRQRLGFLLRTGAFVL